MIATVHGEAHWRQVWDVNLTAAPRRVRLRSKLLGLQRRLRGFAHWRGDGWEEQRFPDYYHTSWHRPSYVRRHWSRWFEVLRIEEATVRGTHDFVVLRRR